VTCPRCVGISGSSDCCGNRSGTVPWNWLLYSPATAWRDSEWAGDCPSPAVAGRPTIRRGWLPDGIDRRRLYVNRTGSNRHPSRSRTCFERLPGARLPAANVKYIVRSSGVVKRVVYGKDQISYSPLTAVAPATEVLRLSYLPVSITADGKPLESQKAISANGYVHGLARRRAIVTIRHDGKTNIVAHGARSANDG